MTELITVFGGSGFLGKYVVRALCKAGKRVRVAMRRPHLGNDLRVMGAVGQVQLVQANVRNKDSVLRALEGSTAAINLVGLLYEKGKQEFESTMAQGAKNIAEAAKHHGITKLIQVSAIGADAASPSKYAKAKAEAEKAVLELVPSATIIRPSVLFGTEDNFFNKFAAISRITPIMPLIGGGKTIFQPVFVGDVAKAILAAIDSDNSAGKTYELGGPEKYSFEYLIKYIQKVIDRPRAYMNVPFGIMKMIGGLIDGLSRIYPFAGPAVTGDQITLMEKDNVVSDSALGFKDLGINGLTTLEAIAPSYLYRFRPRGQFEPKVMGKNA